MSDELKDQRVVVLMTPTESEAIDEWGFANRIRSKGEAIRRLCQIGLALERREEDLERLVQLASVDSADRFHEAVEALPENGDQAALAEAMMNIIGVGIDAVHAAGQLGVELMEVLQKRDAFAYAETMDKAREIAEKRDALYAKLKLLIGNRTVPSKRKPRSSK